ncbi:MAG TPA: nuclear transport factor 2 family protein [Candidatus Polarisedimenticolaceae bacterium]|nr:nuclear transport factor 2 family protein [Candidatus Polarisedimenticolaceae bacterium]
MPPLLSALVVVAMPAVAAPGDAGGEAVDLAALATQLVRDYHAGDADALRPHVAPGMVFRDPGLGQRFDLDGFVASVAATAGARTLAIEWTGVAGSRADVRGRWTVPGDGGGRPRELSFSIELEFDPTGERPRVVSWLDDFRRGPMWKPARGNAGAQTEHFTVVYFDDELSAEEANRLGATLEKWYDATRRYLGRSFDEGYRLDVDVAGAHGSPFASNPGPEAFILVPARSAKREYAFSMVHELTHNLVGLSWLCRNEHERNGVELPAGNRLLDEGLGVYVEEKLTGEGPRVFPNFGEETHAAYWRAREAAGEPVWPALEAELHREHGDRRLGYLAQASFCKFLVDTYGLDRFLRLFAVDPAAAESIYDKPFAALDDEWRRFLGERFGAAQ